MWRMGRYLGDSYSTPESFIQKGDYWIINGVAWYVIEVGDGWVRVSPLKTVQQILAEQRGNADE